MLKNIVGAALGSKIAKESPVLGGAAGTALATAVPFVLSRASLPAMLAIGAGGYFAKRYFDKKKREEQKVSAEKLTSTEVGTPGKAPESETGSVINPPPGGAMNGSGKAATSPASASA